MALTIQPMTGAALDARLDALAALRIAVFRDWPYLYDGDMDYERRYVATYRDSPGAILVGAFDGDQIVGAATGTPMEDHPEFAEPLSAAGL
ncbi:MAG TPA: GNAT family N-acetyltransferase, partial [Paracoccaceae bacterium]|nr:GNAT family N-acetyltransferase [Paracoccaceae bacterium]